MQCHNETRSHPHDFLHNALHLAYHISIYVPQTTRDDYLGVNFSGGCVRDAKKVDEIF